MWVSKVITVPCVESLTTNGNLILAMAEACKSDRGIGGLEPVDLVVAPSTTRNEVGRNKWGAPSAVLRVVSGSADPAVIDRYVDRDGKGHPRPISERGGLREVHKKSYLREDRLQQRRKPNLD